MRKYQILYASVLTLGLSLASCSKDEDSSNASASIVGKWVFSKEGTIVGGNEVLDDYSGNESGCSKDYSILNANGTMIDVDYDSFNSPCEMFTDNATWTRSGNTITVTFEGEPADTFQILKLTSSELKIKDVDGVITVFTKG